ncbi:hypothetical protein HNO88_000990 [Novosphingobium chloroacetimidivorans]|uniref:Uncharacterized protein n=1 Tax=Novosphingobium chloroacetimidivorans TaxID=1428314 RepID=A0A7W7K8K7_9SPHN|nr:hypothetical protein [Novosphingobium chloroacetimidivorans]MBB4857679.1 hypothetical protein [Novosphingobium chloroacetimidivorans]
MTRPTPDSSRGQTHDRDEAEGRARPAAPVTPDGRYLVVRGRLWRRSNPHLDEARRKALVAELMDARRAVKSALHGAAEDLRTARGRVDAAKVALGERGPVWWDDGAPDYNRHLVRNTPYAQWHALPEDQAFVQRAMKKPSSPPSSRSMPGSVRSQPS